MLVQGGRHHNQGLFYYFFYLSLIRCVPFLVHLLTTSTLCISSLLFSEHKHFMHHGIVAIIKIKFGKLVKAFQLNIVRKYLMFGIYEILAPGTFLRLSCP